jgi:ubiquinone/menaquinone biosynthesis C-methylase UbiE
VADHPGGDRRFSGAADRLRAPARVALMEVPRVLSLLLDGTPAPLSALDVGTGTGLWAEAFASRGLRTGAVEPNTELLGTARSLVTGVDFRKGTAESIPWEDAAFDLVFLGHVLHETDDLLAALREAGRVARVRVGILEWPWRQEDRGPPLDHRLAPARVLDLAAEAGFPRAERVTLTAMELYVLELPAGRA